jgi:prepilin-type N-terminal cleavage/methylation domain-containing protein
MSFKSKQKGFTLIETLFVLAIFAAVSVVAIEQLVDKTRIESGQKFGKKLTSIIGAIDQRFFIEGYEEELWVDLNGVPLDKTLTYTLRTFIKEQLYSNNHSCVSETGSAWIIDEDLVADNAKYGLNNCNLFPANKYDLTMTDANVSYETLTYGGLDSIKKIAIDFNISTVYTVYMKELIAAVEHSNKITTLNVSGVHQYSFYDLDIGEMIRAPICLKNLIAGKSCVLRAELDTMASDGTSYLKTTGFNKMGGNVEFRAKPDDRTDIAALEDCYVWHYDPVVGGWTNFNPSVAYDSTSAAIESSQIDVPCGLRYDSVREKDDEGNTVEVKQLNITGHNISSTNSISLSKTCDTSQFSSGSPNFSIEQSPSAPFEALYKNNSDIMLAGSTFSCGLFRNKDGDNLVIALVDDVYANTVNANTVNANTVKVKELFAEEIDAKNGKFFQLNTNSIGGVGEILNIAEKDILISSTGTGGGISLSGIVDVNDTVTTTKGINEFTLDSEFVSKEYVDFYTDKYVGYINNNHLNGDRIYRSRGTEFTGTNIICNTDDTEVPVVSPVQTHSTPTVLTYTVEKYSNNYRVVVVDGDGVEDLTAKTNVVVFCEK